ncbi:MAG: T9SS type A sorting domain-containing protein [Balneolaceae bacterium]
MQALNKYIALIFFICLFLPLLPARAQPVSHLQSTHSHFYNETLLKIEKAVQNNRISADEGMLQKFYAGYRPEALMPEFRETSPAAIRCMTPLFIEYLEKKENLNPAIISEIEQILTTAQLTSASEEYLSPSGNFILRYETSGEHAVPPDDSNNSGIPDFVELAAHAADSSYRYQVEQLGFTDFLIPGSPYEITFRNFNFFGTTTSQGATTFITLHSNYEGFPPNTHPDGNVTGALLVTVAHEVKHAIQFANNRWQGNAGSFDVVEMDATLMEEIVHDDVNDYYNLIPRSSSIFKSPQIATPGAYWHVTWMLYFAETFGMDFWVDVWRHFETEPLKPFLTAIEEELILRGTSLRFRHLKNHLWHVGSGPVFSPPDYGFRERLEYPDPSFFAELTFLPDSLQDRRVIQPFAANYLLAKPSGLIEGQAKISFEFDQSDIGLGAIAYFKNGTTDVTTRLASGGGKHVLETTWNWNELDQIALSVVNTSRVQGLTYNVFIDSGIPDEFNLAQNFPNPFNPVTTIQFALPQPGMVKLNVYNAIGQHVQTLINNEMQEGNQQVVFDATGLASGVYFYRLETPGFTRTKKMMLLK